MLARAQEIENLERQQRAQALIADEASSALVRSEAAYTEASLKLASVRREAAEAQTRAHQLQVELMRLAQLVEATAARSSQLDEELAEIDAQLEGAGRAPCHRRGSIRRAGHAARRHAGASRRTRRSGDRRRARAGGCARARPCIGAASAGGAVPVAHAGRAPRRVAARDRHRRGAGGRQRAGGRADAAPRWPRSTMPSRRPACRPRWRSSSSARARSRRSAASTTTSRPSCAASTNSA